MRYIAIFDLDGTVVDSRHRTPCREDGSLDLDGYIARHTPANVRKDRLLPCARLMLQAWDNGGYVIVLTARDMRSCDYQFLAAHGLRYHKLFSRDQASPAHYKLSDGEYKARWIVPFLQLKQFASLPVVMYDDAMPVKSALRRHFPVLCAHKINTKLSQ